MTGWFDRAAAAFAPEADGSPQVDAWQLPEPAPEAPSDSFPALRRQPQPADESTNNPGAPAGTAQATSGAAGWASATNPATDGFNAVAQAAGGYGAIDDEPTSAARQQVRARQPQIIGPTPGPKPRGRWFRNK